MNDVSPPSPSRPDATSWWTPTDVGITVSVRAVPNSRRTELVGTFGDALKIRIASPAVDGAANDLLRRFVADAFEIRKSAVRIVRGRRSRNKTIQIVGIDEPPPRVRHAVD